METGSRDYVTIPKGRGYVYAYENQLYNRIKTEGRPKYLKCDVSGCDGSAKKYCRRCISVGTDTLCGADITMILRLY